MGLTTRVKPEEERKRKRRVDVNSGHLLDKNGDQKDWWDSKTFQEFDQVRRGRRQKKDVCRGERESCGGGGCKVTGRGSGGGRG